jgi:hypothetical protein
MPPKVNTRHIVLIQPVPAPQMPLAYALPYECVRITASKGDRMLQTVVIILLILLLLGALPLWPYSSSWGVYPSGGLGLILIIVVIVLLVGRR